jgi:hypothetical protein
MNTTTIKLYDDERYAYPFYQYPIIEIKEGFLEQFKQDLEEYRNNEEGSYNIDDFIAILETKKYFVRAIYSDYEIYF